MSGGEGGKPEGWVGWGHAEWPSSSPADRTLCGGCGPGSQVQDRLLLPVPGEIPGLLEDHWKQGVTCRIGTQEFQRQTQGEAKDRDMKEISSFNTYIYLIYMFWY